MDLSAKQIPHIGGLLFGATGYWVSDSLASKYSKNHVFEESVSYTFKQLPLTIEWNTVFAGEGAYSS